MASRPAKETTRNQEATVYIGNIDENVDDELVSFALIIILYNALSSIMF